MSSPWRLFREALRHFTRLATAAADGTVPPGALRYVPAAALATGTAAAGAYWLSAQLWPASIAVVLSMAATAAIAGGVEGSALGVVFLVLVKYNALMALSAANVPLTLPPFLGLGLIMICGLAASGAVQVAVLDTSNLTASPASRWASPHGAPLGTAVGWILGFAPALLLGIPGLVGLATTIATGLCIRRFARPLPLAQPALEAAFYLGALAAWRYV